jgi:hypothetical protein
VVVFSLAFLLFKVLRKLPGSWNLRLEEDLELEGIDITEHGTVAYHMEFGQGMTYATSGGFSPPAPPSTPPPSPPVSTFPPSSGPSL